MPNLHSVSAHRSVPEDGLSSCVPVSPRQFFRNRRSCLGFSPLSTSPHQCAPGAGQVQLRRRLPRGGTQISNAGEQLGLWNDSESLKSCHVTRFSRSSSAPGPERQDRGRWWWAIGAAPDRTAVPLHRNDRQTGFADDQFFVLAEFDLVQMLWPHRIETHLDHVLPGEFVRIPRRLEGMDGHDWHRFFYYDTIDTSMATRPANV